ncbi:hypothetical protein BDY21DRAFT_394594 [Lineolata rhizophorae]|uniref:Uncharacterized protein n=1 Tax=Lineolata rhizophorae TaxID=578093 RepID=A0A6A6NXA4_9PEZI|nr:hypothetical protein BDY21DRAFT_394594 [Lineolata rhizophorae]
MGIDKGPSRIAPRRGAALVGRRARRNVRGGARGAEARKFAACGSCGRKPLPMAPLRGGGDAEPETGGPRVCRRGEHPYRGAMLAEPPSRRAAKRRAAAGARWAGCRRRRRQTLARGVAFRLSRSGSWPGYPRPWISRWLAPAFVSVGLPAHGGASAAREPCVAHVSPPVASPDLASSRVLAVLAGDTGVPIEILEPEGRQPPSLPAQLGKGRVGQYRARSARAVCLPSACGVRGDDGPGRASTSSSAVANINDSRAILEGVMEAFWGPPPRPVPVASWTWSSPVSCCLPAPPYPHLSIQLPGCRSTALRRQSRGSQSVIEADTHGCRTLSPFGKAQDC